MLVTSYLFVCLLAYSQFLLLNQLLNICSYLGQELTARSQHVGVVRKRVMPILILSTDTQVPRPWILASMIQERGHEYVKDRYTNPLFNDSVPPPLPNISAAGVGAIASVIQGSVTPSKEHNIEMDEASIQKLREEYDALMNDLEDVAGAGVKIKDKNDGKTIGQVISSPADGTSILLAQMRLDRVGLLEGDHWNHKNRIIFGDSKKEFRYLPYVPVWWPDLDPKSGKEDDTKKEGMSNDHLNE